MVSGSSDDVSIATSGGHDKHPSRRSHANQDLVDGSLDLVEDKVQIVHSRVYHCRVLYRLIFGYKFSLYQSAKKVDFFVYVTFLKVLYDIIQVSDLGSNTGDGCGSASDSNVGAKEEELCQLVINVLFTVMWRGRAGVSGL